MTAEEIMHMCATEGFYIVGDRRHSESCSQPVGVLCGKPHLLRLGTELSTNPQDWHPDSYLAGGPISVRSLAELDRKAQLVQEEVALLDHDAAFWRGLALKAKQLIRLASFDSHTSSTAKFAQGLYDQISAAEAAEVAAKKRKEEKA